MADRRSYEKFNYALRPSKQVERKLIIETLHYLGHNAGYSTKDYAYVGFGSVYYTDFILFHKYLYINDMICVEGSDIPRRMKFNKPYLFIEVRMGKVSTVLPELNFERKYVVWLDYDLGVDYGPWQEEPSILDDVAAFAAKLLPGSFLIITAEAEPRLTNTKEYENLSVSKRDSILVDILNTNYADLLEKRIRKADLTRKEMPRIVSGLLRRQLSSSVLRNYHCVKFRQLFNFNYADGAQMVTVGGLIDRRKALDSLKRSRVYSFPFVHGGKRPVSISVPPLTVREKEAIDAQIEKISRASSINLDIELHKRLLANYLKYYKHYPIYHEAIL